MTSSTESTHRWAGRPGDQISAAVTSRRNFFAVGGGLAAAAAVAACSMTDTKAATLGDLRTAIRGHVLLPGDPGFDTASRPWNRIVDQSVRAVAEISDADDAAALIRYAGDAGLVVAVQPNGHGASGTLDGTILVRTNRLDEVRIDPVSRTARVGAGVSWNRVQAAAAEHGLTGAPGSSPAVGVAGYTLGGGLSVFGRAFGWAAESVTAFEVIDADGHASRATPDSEADLFWALRGGGGDYAFVTAIEFDLHPAPTLYGGRILWPVENAARVLAAFRQITATAPDELTVWWNLFQFPGAPPMAGIDTTYLGDAAAGQALLQQLDRIDGRVSDTRNVLPLTQLGSITAEPTDPSPSRQYAELLAGIDDSVAEKLLTKPIAPLLNVQIRHLGGALARHSHTAPGAIPEPYCLGFVGEQTTSESASLLQTRIQEYRDDLGQALSGRTPFTMLSPGQTAARAFSADTLTKLREIKRQRDPKCVFRSNYTVLT